MSTQVTNKSAKLVSKEYVNSSKTAELLRFQLPIPDQLGFKPGQFISIKVQDKPMTYRAYSICSDPASQNEFEIVVTTDIPGIGVNYLKKLKEGQDISFIGPGGRFFLRESLSSNLVFVATGTGIAPFIPMLTSLAYSEHKDVNEEELVKTLGKAIDIFPDKTNVNSPINSPEKSNVDKKIHIYYGVRTVADLFFYDQLLMLQNLLPNLSFTVCFSKQPDIKNFKLPNSVYGRVTNYLNIESPLDTQIYICGNPNMVEEVKELSLSVGIPSDKIYFEKFNYAKSKKSE